MPQIADDAKKPKPPAVQTAAPTAPLKLSKDEQKIKDALDAHDPRLWNLYRRGIQSANLEYLSLVTNRYQRGKLLLEAGRYGEPAAMALAAALQLSRSAVFELVMVAKRISAQELNHFQKIKTKTGMGLSWTHLLRVAEVTDPAVRRKLVDKAAAENWSVEALYEEVQKLNDDDRSTIGRRDGAGRPFLKPKSFGQLLHKTEKAATSFDKYLDEAVSPYFDELLMETPPDQIDQESLEEMQAVALRLEKIVETAGQVKQRLQEQVKELAEARALPMPGAKPKPKRDLPAGRRRTGPDAEAPALKLIHNDAPRKRGRPKKAK